MKTASLFKNGSNQAVRLPRGFEFEGVSEVEVTREGDAVILRPVRKTWTSFALVEKAEDDFLTDRTEVIEEGRIIL